MAPELVLRCAAGASLSDRQRLVWAVALLLAVLAAPSNSHPMLDAITNWVKKAGKTKLGEAWKSQ